ncbi:hypothetical protein EK21DRAFT_119118 [Setomelanomma holmii]|uniref:Uncharacterized protein n=1 Tax=Setomelanomma holmii TaxID=210430 RepID=A0A9P4GWM0_9PLEO|nr:hypothetical protein EK21DRAFT_119118 [Setomelanomma holmii]
MVRLVRKECECRERNLNELRYEINKLVTKLRAKDDEIVAAKLRILELEKKLRTKDEEIADANERISNSAKTIQQAMAIIRRLQDVMAPNATHQSTQTLPADDIDLSSPVFEELPGKMLAIIEVLRAASQTLDWVLPAVCGKMDLEPPKGVFKRLFGSCEAQNRERFCIFIYLVFTRFAKLHKIEQMARISQRA